MTTYASILDHPTLPAKLIAHYNFNGPHPVDVTQTLTNGVIEGTAPIHVTPGLRGYSVSFGGAGDLNLGTAALLNPDTIAISVWFQAKSAGPGYLVSRRSLNTDADVCYGIVWSTNNVSWHMNVGGTVYTVTSPTTLSQSVWYHVVAVFDGSYLSLYLNGKYVDRVAASGVCNKVVVPTIAGCRANGASPYSGRASYFTGYEALLSFFTGTLTPSEVNDLYAGGAGLPYRAISGAAVRSHSTLMTDIVGSYLHGPAPIDQMASMRNATVYNSPTFTAYGVMLNGSTQYLRVADDAEFHGAHFGISGWVYFNAVADGKGIITKKGTTGWANLDWSIQLASDSGTVKISFALSRDGVNGVTCFAASVAQTGFWYHIAADFDGVNARLFVNGCLHSTQPLSGDMEYRAQGYKIRFGAFGSSSGDAEPTSSTSQVNGNMCDILFHARSYTLGEVWDIYFEGSGMPWIALNRRIDLASHPTLKTGVIAVYELDGIPNDSGPNGLNGTGANGILYDAAYGKANKGAFCDGATTRHISLGTSEILTPDQISISAWVQPRLISATWQAIVARKTFPDSPSVKSSYDLNLNGSTNPQLFEFWVVTGSGSGTGGSVLTSIPAVNATWVHLTGSFDGTKLRIYRNGVLCAIANHPSPGNIFKSTLTPTLIGSIVDGGSFPTGRTDKLTAYVDQVIIHDRPLTDDEAADIFNSAYGLLYQAFPADVYLLEHGAYPVTLPKLVAAVPVDAYTVRLYFDSNMKHTNPLGDDDALNPENYSFSSFTGVPITPTVVDLVEGDPTVVDVTTNKMTGGAVYAATVSNVRSVDDSLIDPGNDSADFTAASELPVVESATVLTFSNLKVQFDQLLLHNSTLADPGNYDIDGPTALGISTATPIDEAGKTYVTLLISGEMRIGSTYTVTVEDAEDLASNHLDEDHDSASFVGVGTQPQVLPDTIEKANMYIAIRFNELMGADAELVGSYSILPSLDVLEVERYMDYYTYKLTTEAQTHLTPYTLSVSAAVKDLAGNPIDPAHDTVDFLGSGYSPPELAMHPPSGTEDFPIRSRLKITARDIAFDHTGIDESSWWIKMSFTSPTGGPVEQYIVKDGVLQSGFLGTHSGDPLDVTTGVSWLIRPRAGWIPETRYTITSYVRDNEGTPNENLINGIILTASPYCSEDNLSAFPETSFDQAMRQRLSRPKGEKFRHLLMESCSMSKSLVMRSRTILYLAARLELRSLLAGYADLALLDGLCLCDRISTLELHRSLLPYWSSLPGLVSELPVDDETKGMLLRHIKSDSPVYTVAGIAAAVIVAAMSED